MTRRQRNPIWGEKEKPAKAQRHGLSQPQIQVMWTRQEGRCSICQRMLDARTFVVDHDHALARKHPHPVEKGCPQCVRALLCRPCNHMLGDVRDDPEVLMRGAAYLKVARARP